MRQSNQIREGKGKPRRPGGEAGRVCGWETGPRHELDGPEDQEVQASSRGMAAAGQCTVGDACGSDTRAGNGGAECGSAPGPSPGLRLRDAAPGCRPTPPLLSSGHTPLLELLRIILSSSLMTSPSIHGAPPVRGLPLKSAHCSWHISRRGPGRGLWGECDSCTFRWHLSF